VRWSSDPQDLEPQGDKTVTASITRRTALGAAIAALAGTLPLLAHAQSGTVRFILPNATGSGVDTITRAAQPALGKALNANVVVENQPGAGGVVGLQALARSAPDGNTLAVVSNNVVIFPSVLKSLPFDMPGDFTPIAVVGATPMVLVVNPAKVAATNHREFAALLKSKPGALNFASGGNGTILHLATELYLDAAGASAKHIPYKGVGPMVTDLIGGQVDFGTVALPSVQQHIKSGALRAIGMLSPQRTAAAPEIPTFAEQGLANFAVEAWFAVIGPKGMNAASVKKAHDAVVAAFGDPTVKEAMAKQGNSIHISTPEQTQTAFRSEMAKYAALVKKVGLEPQ
jgi:tripartite-type tricarboxylate transporter receptor subunit TctC